MKIIDEFLFPYEIKIDENNFSVEEDLKKMNSKNELTYKNHGYYGSIESALNKIITLKLHENKNVITLKEYIEEYRKIKEQIKKSIKFS